jgi:hypothetical protein
MHLVGVRVVVAVAAAAALLPLASAGAASPTLPPCFKGQAGCKHSLSRYWRLAGFTGSVTATGSRSPALTCADLAGQERREILSGTYEVDFALDKARSKVTIGADRTGNPRTPAPLRLRFKVTRNTHEQVRVLMPNADGSGCTEATHQCGQVGSVLRSDRMSIFTRNRRVHQDFAGAFLNPSFVQCAADADTPSLLPPGPLDGRFMAEITHAANFHHRTTHLTVARDIQLENNAQNVAVDGHLTYTRWLHACTYYGDLHSRSAQIRCRDARG